MSEFSLTLNFLQNFVDSTNEDNFGKILLSLFNVLFIWFDLGVLDLHPFFVQFCSPLYLLGKINRILLFARNRLKKFKASLYEILIPQR